MKINNLVEELFSIAVALDQSGGLKNTIYAANRNILIMNYDHTVLIRFRLRQSEGVFEHPVSFKANDYDSNIFEEKDGRIIFYTEKGGYERKKVCGTSDLTTEEVKELFEKYVVDEEPRQAVELSEEVLSLLDDSLSHIEFSGEKGGSIKMVQRNIYSGGIIEIKKSNKGLFTETLDEDFGPVAIKTDDFKALFSFQSVLKFEFPTRGAEDYIMIRSLDKNKRDMVAIVACCLYDELIQIKEVQKNGRQKQKIGRSK